MRSEGICPEELRYGIARLKPAQPASPWNFFQLSLFQLFLTLDAMLRPWHRFEALGTNLSSARDAFPKRALAHARQCVLDHLQKLAVVVALMKEELLRVGARRAVRYILCRIVIHGPAVLFDASHHEA
jgi:hypothetical protein